MTRSHRNVAWATWVFAVAAAASITAANAGTLGGPLELADDGSFFIGGQMVRSEFPGTPGVGGGGPGSIMINQMYVQFRIPKTVSAPPSGMVNGSGHTGATYETTTRWT